MRVLFESKEYREFDYILRRLLEKGEIFDKETLKLVPYYQLHLCCIGNAGEAVCSSSLVHIEKQTRRDRFLNMEPEEFKAATNFLKLQQMYDDVMYAISYRTAPKWENLTDCQKLWAKLTCLYNHVENPFSRLEEIQSLFSRCEGSSHSELPVEVCKVYAHRLGALNSVYPGGISDGAFRDKIGEIAATIQEFLPDNDVVILEKERLQDFSCTSDCFRVM